MARRIVPVADEPEKAADPDDEGAVDVAADPQAEGPANTSSRRTLVTWRCARWIAAKTNSSETGENGPSSWPVIFIVPAFR